MLNREEQQALSIRYAPHFKSWFKKNKKKLEKMDAEVQVLHEEAMEETDCLNCANCCRTLGPAISDKDIDRMAKALRMKPSEVVSQYLRIDEDKDYVFQTMPCPFLMPDNYCSIYESRPKACREYPHTDRKKFYQIYNLTVKNTETCPAAFKVLQRLTQTLGLVLICLSFAASFSSCNKKAEALPSLVEIDEITELYPDSALALLKANYQVDTLDKFNRSYYNILFTGATDKLEHLLIPCDSLIDYSIKHLDKKTDPILLARAYMYKGKIWKSLNEFENAVNSLYDAINLLEDAPGSYPVLTKIYDLLGYIYSIETMLDESLEMHQKAYELDIQNENLRNAAYSLVELGQVHLVSKRLEEVMPCYEKAKEYARTSADSVRLFDFIYNCTATYYDKIGEYELALQELDKIKNAQNNHYLNKGNTYLALQNYDSAGYYLNLYNKEEDIYSLFAGHYYLYLLEKETGNYEKALYHLDMHQEAIDSIYDIKKTAEIYTINHKHNIKTATEKLRNQHRQNIGIFVFVLIILVFSFIVIFLVKSKKKKIQQINLEKNILKRENEIISLRNEIVETQNKILQLGEEKKEEIRILEEQSIQMIDELQCHSFRATAIYKKIERVNKNRTKHELDNQERDQLKESIMVKFAVFVDRLKLACPLLKDDQLFFCCLIKLGLSSYTISRCLCISEEGVRKKKYDIKKLMSETPEALQIFTSIFEN